MKFFKNQKGMGIVEILVVSSIIIIAFMAILQLFQVEVRTERLRREKLQAYALMSESLEAVRSMRDEDWNSIDGLLRMTNYYPEISSGSWALSTIDPGPTDGFTLWVVIEDVNRDINDDIVSSAGTLDPDTLEVTAYAQWEGYGSAKTELLSMYITNWQD